MQISGSKELLEQVRNSDLCTVCGACVGLCPYHQSYKGKIALTFECDISQCQCYAYCPQTGVDTEILSRAMFDTPYNNEPLGQYSSIKSAKAGEKITATGFQNGGTVSALIMFALEEKWIDSAVLTGKKGFLPEPMLVEDSAEVANCATTKYMATPTLLVLNKAIKEGKKNIGAVGTGCQSKALAIMKTNPLEKEEYKNAIALSLGLFCTWSLDTRKFVSFLSKKTDPEKIIGMDIPPPPAEVFVLKTQNGQIEFPLKEIRPMIPTGCTKCPDMTAQWADVSVGAFEGKPGWNTLIIRSKKGEQWVESAKQAGYLTLDEFPKASLDHLILGAGNKKKRVEQTMKEEKK